MTTTTERWWKAGQAEAVFGDHVKVIAPWHSGNRRRALTLLDDIQVPVRLRPVDPRRLSCTQTWVVRHHVEYYLTGEWERTGRTSADRGQAANRFPIVVGDTIVAGHHRTAAALLAGRMLLVRAVEGAGPIAVTPTLFIGAEDPQVVGATTVGDDQAARLVLERRGLSELEVADRMSMATTGRVLGAM